MQLPQGLPTVGGGTESFWRTNLHELDDYRSTVSVPEQSDIVIIGAGYAGVATAYHLLEAGSKASITLLEARGACSGATGRNGGHLRPDLYGHIPTHIDRQGLEAGAEIAEFEASHITAIKKVVVKEKIDCDFVVTRTTDVWCNQDAAERAKASYDKMVAYGLKHMDDVDFYIGKDAEGISGIKHAKACATYTAGTIWPYKFIMTLLGILRDRGVNVQTYTPVNSVTSSSEGQWTVSTSRGDIKAQKVVHAANAYTKTLLPEYEKSIIPCKGICCHIAVPKEDIAPFVNNSYIIREKGDPSVLSYLIPRSDGSIIVGGSQAIFKPFEEQWYNNTDDAELIEASKDYYTNYMQNNFRGWENTKAEVKKIWTGVMGYTNDTNPHIGEVPGKPGQYILAGFNGHGMPVIWLSAKGVSDMLHEGKKFEDAKMPRAFKTTQERIDKAKAGPKGGDILA
ncbi:FAD dependent oxidoreductase superfamily [Aureobasidium sp. EXF-3400]|nr:FAD dependent oxidoreductase superfamily [Aureobasidium sp. EXF-12344]KAI4781778.1 FAD dependent oxidoreductase superfamily [Aureobasidium sp. EXF-3400]